MSTTSFLAFDFGAESGRAILGSFDGKKINLQEIHRFPNRQIKILGHIYWDVLYLFDELKIGLAKAAKICKNDLLSIGVNTWGVDFGLIGRGDQLIGYPFCYRDYRTDGMMELAFQLMPKQELYSYTGIQFMQLNSIFQLLSMVATKNVLLDCADKLLFMPDIFNFLMTGEKCSEYTIASTSQLLNAKNPVWEPEIFKRLNLPIDIMAPVLQPGSVIGSLLPEIVNDTGASGIDVIAPACHDTASAVAAIPATYKNIAYLSSGTWSLLGIEADKPIINPESLKNNFTNEGGVNQKIRFLRNTMGLWLLQKARQIWKQQGENLDYNDLINYAEKAKSFKCVVDPDNQIFLNPVDMLSAIVQFCQRTDQSIPETKGEFVRCIFESLALKYRFIIDKINSMRDVSIETLHILGGGSKNELLNQFSSNATGLPVVAGPEEATATGNVIMQAIAKNELANIEEGREIVTNSFALKYYDPEDQEKWNEQYYKVKHLFL